jgi:two-component system chemotaxis response regulator CheB
MGGRDIIVVGASAGGIQALTRLVELLPGGLRAAIFVALHRLSIPHEDVLADFLSSKGSLPAHIARDLQRFERGHIYVGPGDRHLSLQKGSVRVERGPRENRFRPSIDVLFRSAAAAYGSRVAGVVLTGLLDDGTAGLWHIRKHGGATIVQDPADALYPSMPRSAIDNVGADYVLPLDSIPEKLAELSREEDPGYRAGQPSPRVLIVEDERIVAEGLRSSLEDLGYEVTGCVPTGEGAVEQAAAHPPDVVLMDIRLAGEISGVEAAKRIWERSQTPVVYLTGSSDRRTLDDVKTSETYGYIVKPFHAEAIHATIQLALARRERELKNL